MPSILFENSVMWTTENVLVEVFLNLEEEEMYTRKAVNNVDSTHVSVLTAMLTKIVMKKELRTNGPYR
jgi:hypothetical protein